MLGARSVARVQQHHRIAESGAARLTAAMLVLVLVVPGCTSLREWWHNGLKVGPNYVRPPAATAATWIDAADSKISCAPACDQAWWTVFQDPTLNGLIETAYRQNLDLRAA